MGSCQQQPMAGWLARCPAGPPSLGGMKHRAQQKSLHVHAALQA
ncbi:hypothetical protein [Paenibacillus illinoisensis]